MNAHSRLISILGDSQVSCQVWTAVAAVRVSSASSHFVQISILLRQQFAETDISDCAIYCTVCLQSTVLSFHVADQLKLCFLGNVWIPKTHHQVIVWRNLEAIKNKSRKCLSKTSLLHLLFSIWHVWCIFIVFIFDHEACPQGP